MSGLSVYESLRQFADSWGLAAMFFCFGIAVAWPFRPGAKAHNDAAANMIFEGEDDGQ